MELTKLVKGNTAFFMHATAGVLYYYVACDGSAYQFTVDFPSSCKAIYYPGVIINFFLDKYNKIKAVVIGTALTTCAFIVSALFLEEEHLLGVQKTCNSARQLFHQLWVSYLCAPIALFFGALFLCVGIIILIMWIASKIEERPKKPKIEKPIKEEKPRQPNLFWEYLKAKKGKYCPVIEYIDDEKAS